MKNTLQLIEENAVKNSFDLNFLLFRMEVADTVYSFPFSCDIIENKRTLIPSIIPLTSFDHIRPKNTSYCTVVAVLHSLHCSLPFLTKGNEVK